MTTQPRKRQAIDNGDRRTGRPLSRLFALRFVSGIVAVLAVALPVKQPLAGVASQAEWDTLLENQCGGGFNVECRYGTKS